ncbi:protein of unknown function [Pseudodesulfovibrio profundus]|uniref:Uncharacterized protein n=1 Tax=Pseudodesulfovibrio profundus TaxID=57320 RepID=A0A2C8FEJ4_9BACT|nr:protein of unknown function [Pseudodesulfovibrio profundus]
MSISMIIAPVVRYIDMHIKQERCQKRQIC